MAIGKKKYPINLSGQGGLFDAPVSEGALDVDFAFRDAVTRAISSCREKSRYQIAARMSELTGRDISKDMLDKYTSSNPGYNLYARDLPALCAVTSSLEPAQVLLAPLGCEIIDPKGSKYVRLARLMEQKHTLLTEIARLEADLGVKGR